MDSYYFDLNYLGSKCYLAGADEVGRGSLAGPVVGAMVIMNLNTPFNKEVKDSKKLSPKKREFLSDWIKKNSIAYSIGEVNHEIIDKINILEATKLSLLRAYEKIEIKPCIILFDALKINSINIHQEAIIKGDDLSYTIACASIIAKVHRDALMNEYHELYPNYAFHKHKGYGTKEHLEKIKEYGPALIHRKTFKPFSKKIN